jgi:hypothetical protein
MDRTNYEASHYVVLVILVQRNFPLIQIFHQEEELFDPEVGDSTFLRNVEGFPSGATSQKSS